MTAAADIGAATGRDPRARRWRVALVALAGLAALALVGGVVHREARTAFLADAARRGDTTLRLAVASLNGQLARFERLPGLIAEQGPVVRLALDPDNRAMVDAANIYLRNLGQQLSASDIYVMDTTGTTRAASNFDTPTSFVGGNFAFRPYFTEALAGGEGRFFALGTTSLKRGYYFGAPVKDASETVRGVLAFKIDLDAIEETWTGGDDQIVVTDPEGVIFLSSRKDWLFRSTLPLDESRLARTYATRRYATAQIGALPFETRTDSGQTLVSVRDGAATRQFLRLSYPMPEAGWEVGVLVDTAQAERQAQTLALAVMLALGFGAVVVTAILQRRARLAERLQLQQVARDQLERRVAERTAELAELNKRLEGEVAERRAAERDLRDAQDELVQASKMAALGQMSAALSHEFNQPLGAARNYADNALVLFERGRMDEARGNLERIVGVIDRMAAISRTLRSFARKSGLRVMPVDLHEAVVAVSEISKLRLRAADAELQIEVPDDLPPVMAAPVGLQQVLVNLVTNAADAVEGLQDRRIHLSARRADGRVRITVRDHGRGVAPGLRERIFDPFFSTKEVGKGLGLGLSISYNIVKDFGGDLTVDSAEDGGALFTVDLQAKPAETEAG